MNIIDTLNRTIDRVSPDCHPIKRAMLINRALEHMRNRTAVTNKLIRARVFELITRKSHYADSDNMVSYTQLSACYK